MGFGSSLGMYSRSSGLLFLLCSASERITKLRYSDLWQLGSHRTWFYALGRNLKGLAATKLFLICAVHRVVVFDLEIP